MARLGDIATYVNGYAFKPTDWSDEGIQIIRIQDLTGNSYQANRYNGEYAPKYEVNNGDVLISWSASLGVYVWAGEKAVLNQHIFKVKFDKVDVDKSFFVHQVECILNNASGDAHGATMKHLTKPVFDALPFYLPNIEEQRQIATELDKVINLISLRKQQLSKLDELVKSRFIEMFGDPVTNPFGWRKLTVQHAIVEKIIDKPLDGNHGGKHPKTSDYVPSGIPFIMANNLVAGKVDLENCAFISRKQADSLDKGFAKDGDVLITHKGTIGRTAILHCSYPYIMLTPQVTYYRPKIGIIPEYLKAYFDTDYFQGIIGNIASVGSTRAYIGITAQQELPLIVPPMEVQEQYATFVEQIDKSKFEIQKSLEKLETLKKALMQKYFG